MHLFLFLLLVALLFFAVLPWRIALPLYLLVVASSLYLTWRDMRTQRRIPPAIGRKAMIGDRAAVVRVESENAEVDYKGETWKAISDQPLHPGQEVIIVGLEGLVLRVVPLSEAAWKEPSGNDDTRKDEIRPER